LARGYRRFGLRVAMTYSYARAPLLPCPHADTVLYQSNDYCRFVCESSYHQVQFL